MTSSEHENGAASTSLEKCFVTECIALWTLQVEHRPQLESEVDRIFSEYRYYDETEWPKYNVRPNDQFPLLGSWRNTDGTAFSFLTGPGESSDHYRLYIVGKAADIKKMSSLIEDLKVNLHKVEKRVLAARIANSELESEHARKAIERFTSIIGLFSLIGTALTSYLKGQGAPEFHWTWLGGLYSLFLSLIHLLMLALLLITLVIAITYIARYGLMLLRRPMS